MRVEIQPTKKIDKLEEFLKDRVESLERKKGKIIVNVKEYEFLDKVPGIQSFKVEDEEKEGIGGSPIDEQAYARIDSKKDAVKALIATIMGYDLRILDTSREWDYRNLKKYNPDIKHLKFDEPKELLGIEKAVFNSEELETIEIEVDDEEVNSIYREMLT